MIFAEFVTKTYFDDRLINTNKKVSSNKAEHLQIQNELNKLSKIVELI